jgi:hypothetical protein
LDGHVDQFRVKARRCRLMLRRKIPDNAVSGPQLRTHVTGTCVSLGNGGGVAVDGNDHGRTDQPPICIVEIEPIALIDTLSVKNGDFPFSLPTSMS